MKYLCLVMLAVCFSLQAMQTPQLLIAAWQETEETRLREHDEVIITKNPNDTFSAKHFSRPHGCKETRIDLKSVIEMPSLSDGTQQTFVLSKNKERLILSPAHTSWYTSALATHSVAVLATVLFIKGLNL